MPRSSGLPLPESQADRPQAAAWIVLDGTPVIWRGQDRVDTGPVVALAEALAAVIRGTYPRAPPGRQGHFGYPGGARTIRVRR